MSAPFTGALGVVRLQVASEVYVATLPQPMAGAREYAMELVAGIHRIGESAALIPVEDVYGELSWVRARDVVTVDVVPTEDPSSTS